MISKMLFPTHSGKPTKTQIGRQGLAKSFCSRLVLVVSFCCGQAFAASEQAYVQTKDGVFPLHSNSGITLNGVGISSDLSSLTDGVLVSPHGVYSAEDKSVRVSEHIQAGISADVQKQAADQEQTILNNAASLSAVTQTLRDDFNGDGCTDTATIETRRISIYHPCASGSKTRYYNFSSNIAINGVYDTDGQPGKEIGVVNAPRFSLVKDRDYRTRHFTLGNDWAINGHYDADGKDGNEVGIVVPRGFSFIVDDGSLDPKFFPLSGNYAINGHYDADGSKGVEIGIVTPNNLTFLVLRNHRTRNFYMGFGSWAINGHYETDGTAGDEIGVVIQDGFNIYDLRDYRVRNYRITGAYFVNGAQNIDGRSGKEILINNYGNQQNATIYDARYRITFERY